jgi:GAF domain-containing protein
MTENREKDLIDVFVHLADSLKSGHDILDTMHLLVESSTIYTSAVEAGIMLADADGVLHVVASSSERAADVEEAQLGLEQGPCVEAFHTGQAVEVPDIAASRSRWPDFADLAAARGFRAAHAVPLRLRNHSLGGMNLFAAVPGPLSDRDASLVETMAQMASISVMHHQIANEQETVVDELQRALDARVLIEQAKGVIAHRHDVGVDEAFLLLRDHARASGAALRQVAQQVVGLRLDV